MTAVLDLFLHLDVTLNNVIQNYGAWTYGLMFFVIFMETGFVVTPFLPGDSLLFVAGTFAALGSLKIGWLLLILFGAAVFGDSLNYLIGHVIGPIVFTKEYRFLKREYLEKTQRFYEKHGGKTVVLARFVPIVRTFAPFVAGVGGMRYSRFVLFSVLGGFLWTALFLLGGFFFGNIPLVSNNFELVIVVIILISVVPMIIEYVRNRREIAENVKV